MRPVKNKEGRLLYSEAEKRHIIVLTIPNTIDAQDVGVVCNVPEGIDTSNLDESGIMVVFSGKYREHDKIPQQMSGGQTYYYLIVDKIKIK